MMCFLWKVVVCWSLASVEVVARREKLSSTKTYNLCLNEVAEIKCDSPDQMMRVTSAFYNRNIKTIAAPCGAFESKWQSCQVDAKPMVSGQCDDTNICHLLPSDHPNCEEEAFQQMRVVVMCSTAGEGDIVRTEPSRPLQEATFVPCYRSFEPCDDKADTLQAELASDVTSCGAQEGCFHLSFPSTKVYNKKTEPPAPQELIKAQLRAEGEHFWTTYEGVALREADYGVGLKQNNHGTWGICLPKTTTLQNAGALWASMKESFKPEFERRWYAPQLSTDGLS